MRRAIEVSMLLLILCVAAEAQSLCRINKTFLTLGRQPDKYATLTVFQIKVAGPGSPAYPIGRMVLTTDVQGRLLGPDGSVGWEVEQGAFVTIYSGANAQLVGLAANANAGTQYQVPNKTTAQLEELIWGLATIKQKGALLVGGTNGIASQFMPCPDGQTIIWEAAQTLGARCGVPGAVLSVFGRTGAVVAQSGDYTFAQIGSKPTTLAGYGITDAYPLTGNPSEFLTGNQTITLSGDVSGTGATSITATISNLALNKMAVLTANRALISNGSGVIAPSAVTDAELGHLSGVTSPLQTQLNGKQVTGNYITGLTGDVTATGPGSVAASVVRLQGRDLANTAPTNGQAIVWNNSLSRWEPGSIAGGANAALSNLAGVSINAALIPQVGLDLGAQATPWKDVWLYGSGTFGGHSYRLTGAPTGHRVITFPDASLTVARIDATQTFTGTQAIIGNIEHRSAAGANYSQIVQGTSPSNYHFWQTGQSGSGTTLPVAFYIGGTESLRVSTVNAAGSSPAIGVGVGVPKSSVDIAGSAAGLLLRTSAASDYSSLSAGISAGSYTFFQSTAAGSGTTLPFSLFVGSTRALTVDTSSQLGIGTTSPGARLHALTDNSTTNAVDVVSIIGHDSTGTPVAGFGAATKYQLESSTTAARDAAQVAAVTTDATDATRTYKLAFYTVSIAGALTERVNVKADGLGFAGVTFTNLSTTANTLTICTDCAVTSGADNTCTSGGTGAIAARLNGVWRCFATQN